MLGVAKKKTKADEAAAMANIGRPPGNRSGVPIYAYIPPQLRKALNAYLENTRPNPSLTSAVEVALEEFLKERGFWPPPQP